jgi:hypothetical protein
VRDLEALKTRQTGLAPALHREEASPVPSTLPVKYAYQIINAVVIDPSKTSVNKQK